MGLAIRAGQSRFHRRLQTNKQTNNKVICFDDKKFISKKEERKFRKFNQDK
jgi:hypothetical protein